MNTPCINSYKLLCSSGYDLRLWGVRSCVRIQRTTFFLFFNSKIFYDLLLGLLVAPLPHDLGRPQKTAHRGGEIYHHFLRSRKKGKTYSNLNFSTSYGRLTDLKFLLGLLLVSFIWLAEKISLN